MALKIIRDTNDRMGICGASDVASCLGDSEYSSKYEFAMRYLGKEKMISDELQNIYDWGHEYEDFIAGQISKYYGLKLKKSKYAYVHPADSRIICHPDRIVVGKIDGKTIGVEIKSSSEFSNSKWGESDTDNIPVDYVYQCLMYIETGVCDEVYLFRLAGKKLTRYIIKRDQELQDWIVKSIIEELDKLDQGILPPSASYIEATGRIKSLSEEEIANADSDIDLIAKELKEVKSSIKDLEKQEDKLKAQIVDYMNGRKLLLSSQGEKLFTFTIGERVSIDTARIKKEDPTLYETLLETYGKQTITKTLR